MLRTVYAFFLGLLLAVFIGFGINTFYSSPVAPQAPEFNLVGKEGPTAEQQAQQIAFDKARQDFDKNQMNPYNRNVSIIALAAAVILAAIGLLLSQRIDVLADGALLGGVFTLIYSLGRGFAAQSSKYSFLVTAIALAVAIVLGYWRYIRSDPRPPKLRPSE